MAFLSKIFCLLFLAAAVFASDVVDLTNDNFEKLTQATTGGTTGTWFIEFFAPWCGHCKKLAPVWEELATTLKGEINVAKVDVTANRALGKRFKVQGFPTLVMMKRGKMCEYTGQRTKEAMSEWARSTNCSDEIPSGPGFLNQFLGGAVETVEAMIGIAQSNPLVAGSFALVGAIVGFFIGMIFGSISKQHPQKMSQAKPQLIESETKKSQ